jgi:ABC-type branched-subunit amino acid transport system ATPase component
MMGNVVLDIDHIEKSFGGVRAIDNVSFTLVSGQVLGLIGPNGAGKTTIFNIVNGIYRADGGAVRVEGRNIVGLGPADIACLGIARTFQVPRTFNDMSVSENLQVPLVGLGLTRKEMDRRINDMLATIRLGAWRDRQSRELAGGQRKLLELARAIIHRPKVLILDEPFSGASSDVIDLTIGIVKELAKEKTACLVISHDIVSMPRLCREVVVLIGGAVLMRGPLEKVRQDPGVIEAYLGS